VPLKSFPRGLKGRQILPWLSIKGCPNAAGFSRYGVVIRSGVVSKSTSRHYLRRALIDWLSKSSKIKKQDQVLFVGLGAPLDKKTLREELSKIKNV